MSTSRLSIVVPILALLALTASAQETPSAAAAAPLPPQPGPPPIEVVDPPLVLLAGSADSITLRATGALVGGRAIVELRRRNVTGTYARGELVAGTDLVLDLPALGSGTWEFDLVLPGQTIEGLPLTLRVVPGWATLLPPLLAIAFALAFRQVVPALLGGIWIGASIVYGGPLGGFLRTVDRYAVESLGDGDHVKIVLFTLMLGGMVGIISRSGGTVGLVEKLAARATNSRRGQIVTWLLGIVIFFDDYANTLLVGNTMRPVTDRLRISREKLAYIVDSTAAPVAAIALVSTWIGYEVGLIGDALEAVGSDREAYAVFLHSLPYNFYPILALVFGLMVASSRRDFGPMLKAERRAAGGKVLADGAVPLADFEGAELAPPESKPRRWPNAVIPVLSVLVVTFGSLWITGRSALTESGDAFGTLPLWQLGTEGLGAVFSEGASYNSLLYGAVAGCLIGLVLALGQRILTLGEGLAGWVAGMKSMMVAMVILVLAWGIGDVCADLRTADFMVAALSDALNPALVPALIFVLAALTAFATGTSWTTMALLIPLAVPTAFGVAEAAGLSDAAAYRILLASVSSVLAGALFGDHCSPISDTTVLSSTSSGCDHVDHVRTQLPYALTVALVALTVGYLPAGFGLHPLLCLLLAAGLLALLLRLIGRPIQAAP